jgi:histidine ammonia-lyase
MAHELVICDRTVELEAIAAVARGARAVRLSDDPAWVARIARGRKFLEDAAAGGQGIYGVTTGVGRTSWRRLAAAESALQVNIIRMHNCGVGPLLSEEEARGVMCARLVSLAKGYSGVRLELLASLARLIDSGLVPAIPSLGSVGASGDLTPLSYVGALLIGEGEALRNGVRVPGAEALRVAGLSPFALAAKEGLALMNGTSVMSALGTLAALRARRLIDVGEQACALMLQLLDGRSQAFHLTIHRVKPHAGQIASAQHIRACLEGRPPSVGNGKESPKREIQDRYSIRCSPHLLGAARDALAWAEGVLATEVNGVSDNPLVDPDSGEILNGGNFYGGHVALAMDLLKVALATAANLFDRQFALLVGDANHDYPETLLPDEWLPPAERGLHHGLKALQITVSALAALVSQRSSSDAVHSRQTECGNQDIVSMGTNAALNARAAVELTEQILAGWLIALSQAAAIKGEGVLSPHSRELVARIRAVVPVVKADRPLDAELERLAVQVVRGDAGKGLTARPASHSPGSSSCHSGPLNPRPRKRAR